MKHIILNTFGSLGDLHPYLALGLSLQARGHQVTIATQAYYRDKVLETGLGFHATRPDYRPDNPEVLERAMHPVSGTEYVIRDMSFPFVKATYTDLLEILPEADLLVAGSLAYAAPIAVEKTGIPWLSSVLQPIQFFSRHDPPVLYPFLPEWLRRLPWLYRLGIKLGKHQTERWARPVYNFREELGLSKGKNPALEGQYSLLGTLALFSPTFAPPQPDWPPKTIPTGFLFYDQLTHGEGLDPALKAFLEAGEPPIVFTLGSAAVHTPGDFYKESLKVVKKLGCRAVFLVGKDTRNNLSDVPGQVMIADYAPYSELFPRAAALVHQGGIGTTAQALRAGIPMLVVPFAHDQPDNAARVRRLGAGFGLHRTRYTAERALPLLVRLLQDVEIKARAEVIGRRVRGEDGLERACEVVEAVLAAGSLTR